MPLAYTFGQVMWSMFVFFAWILFFWLLFVVFGDLFSRHDIGGGTKALWTILVIILPFIGIFAYLITQGHAMGERKAAAMQQMQSDTDSYIRSVASSSDPAGQIAQAKTLLDGGTITQAEFDQIKAKALATG
jgi:hypothetical protein